METDTIPDDIWTIILREYRDPKTDPDDFDIKRAQKTALAFAEAFGGLAHDQTEIDSWKQAAETARNGFWLPLRTKLDAHTKTLTEESENSPDLLQDAKAFGNLVKSLGV